jgi:hypothetical protein
MDGCMDGWMEGGREGGREGMMVRTGHATSKRENGTRTVLTS